MQPVSTTLLLLSCWLCFAAFLYFFTFIFCFMSADDAAT